VSGFASIFRLALAKVCKFGYNANMVMAFPDSMGSDRPRLSSIAGSAQDHRPNQLKSFEEPKQPDVAVRSRTARRLDRAVLVVLALAVAYFVADRLWPARRVAVLERAASVQGPASAGPLSASGAIGVSTEPAALLPVVDLSPQGAVERPVVTILEGQALFIRGAARFFAAEGVRLEGGDIVATGADALMQLEYEGGTRVDFGPQTQLMLSVRDMGTAPPRRAYLLAGWIKIAADPKSTRGIEALRSAWFELTIADNVTVTRVAADEADMFAESGNARLLERVHGRSPTELVLTAGQFYARKSQRAGAVSAQASLAFRAQLPASFRDTLPSRIDKFRGRTVTAQPAPDFSYADVEAWLKSDGPIRRQLAERWKDKARDAACRRSLEANLADLPDWVPILYPPKDEPEGPASAPTDHSNATSPPS